DGEDPDRHPYAERADDLRLAQWLEDREWQGAQRERDDERNREHADDVPSIDHVTVPLRRATANRIARSSRNSSIDANSACPGTTTTAIAKLNAARSSDGT